MASGGSSRASQTGTVPQLLIKNTNVGVTTLASGQTMPTAQQMAAAVQQLRGSFGHRYMTSQNGIGNAANFALIFNFYATKRCARFGTLFERQRFRAISMDDESLIREVREHPCLYNTKIPEYKIQLKKENAWKAIAGSLGNNITGYMHTYYLIGQLI